MTSDELLLQNSRFSWFPRKINMENREYLLNIITNDIKIIYENLHENDKKTYPNAITYIEFAKVIEDKLYKKYAVKSQYLTAFNAIRNSLKSNYIDKFIIGNLAMLIMTKNSKYPSIDDLVYNINNLWDNYTKKLDNRVIIQSRIFQLLLYNDILEDKAKEWAIRIEKSCFNAVIKMCSNSSCSPPRRWNSQDFVCIYSNRCGIICLHLNEKNVISKLISGEWLPEDLGSKNAEDLCPEAFQLERQEIINRSYQKVDEAITTLYKCPSCKERYSTCREVQTRAADEASTIFCTCQKCGFNFRGRT